MVGISQASLAGFLAVVTVSAAPPLLERIEPRGGQRGEAVRLTLVGRGLDQDLQVSSAIPGALTPLSQSPRAIEGRERTYLVEIDPNATVNIYPIQVRTTKGLSNVLLFSVGAFPEAAEAEAEDAAREGDVTNDSPELAQDVPTPITINGELLGSDRDFFRFEGKAGAEIVIDAEARRIGSAIDPLIEVVDATGKRIASNDDAPGIGADARLRLSLAKDGEYFVSVRDAKYSDQDENFYRLKIGRFDYAETMFPLGWRRGEELRLELTGGTLSAPATVNVRADKGKFVEVYSPGEPGALPLKLPLGDAAEELESSARSLKPDAYLNGRLAVEGETDRYQLAVQPGQTWHVELQAARLGSSRLYAALTLFDQDGKKLVSTRDTGLREKLSNLDVAEDTTADQRLVFEVPNGVSRLDIAIEDLFSRGGPGFGYRLVAKEQPGDFVLSLVAPQVNIPLRGSAIVQVRADRFGYDGPIKLWVEDPPDDLIVGGGHIPLYEAQGASLSASTGMLVLSPKPGATARDLDLEVWGEATLKGRTIRRRASFDPIVTNVDSELENRLRGRGFRTNVAPPLNTKLKAAIVDEQPATVEMNVPRRITLIQGEKLIVPFTFTSREPGVRPSSEIDRGSMRLTGNVRVGRKLLDVSKDGSKGTFELGPQLGWGPDTFDVVMPVQIRANGRTETVSSGAVTVDVIRAYELIPDEVRVRRESEAAIRARLVRAEGFDAPVEVRANDLPVGVECEPTKVAAAGDFELPCSVSGQAPAGEHEFELVSSSTIAAGGGKRVPFDLPPFKATITVQ